MSYSIISLLALVLNNIINHETLQVLKTRSDGSKGEIRPDVRRHAHFLIAANCYFLADIGWGFLYEHHDMDVLFPFLYIDCVLYFFFMFLSMLTWIRYIVAYLDKHGRKSRVLLYSVWAMFTVTLVDLIVNIFNPFIFSFNDAHEYIPGSGRHLAFIAQIALYLVTSTYMLYIAHKSVGMEKTRYIAVGLTGFSMELFLILQILDQNYPFYAAGLMVGIGVIHSYVEAGEKKEKEIYDHIANSLAKDYDAMYYINIETGEYREFSASQKYASMNVPVGGKNFYTETQANVDRFVHPDDRQFASSLYTKDVMLKKLEHKKSYSYKYRLMINGQSRYFLFTVLRAIDGEHLVLYEKDIDDELTAENIRLEKQKEGVTFSKIAEILAVNYDVIYYVDAANSSYVSYECRNVYGDLDMQKSGDDFFVDSRKDISMIVHKSDRDRVLNFVNKNHVSRALKNQKSISIDYRVTAFRKTHYVRMTIRKTTDDTHYIIGIENIDDEVKKEKQYLKALNTEKELARRDELTGIKNKNAYHELENSIQAGIDNGMDYLPFAFVVCDANNLKKINDTEGHVAGDEYIRNAAKLLCDIFAHSPVFRVGGDEFVVFLSGNDYSVRAELMEKLRSRVLENQKSGSGPILASGMAEFEPETDSLVTDIFDRADKEMYENKEDLKIRESAS